MRNMAVTTFMALGLVAAAALAQQPVPSQPSSPSSSQAQPSNRSGTRTEPAPSQSTAKNSAASPVTFDEADKNADGKLTKKEAKAVHNLSFSSADTDKDAALSREEFQIAMGSAARPRG